MHAADAPALQLPALKVSVVVPVYNPGRHIDACIESIVGQSMPSDEFEAIFVDDGSTDDTPARLDALAARQPNVRVIHQENSGWPGKPRNVGIAAARGEYVYFVDNDDHLGREALERLYDMAARNNSDIVIGKMAGHGRRVPRYLFFENKDRATLADTPLIDSLTPHKLFRRAFLEQHDLRFPEGRRRLEDHAFVVRAFFLARTISVLADYVCYYHVRRADVTNASSRRVDPAGYYGNLREVLAIVDQHTEPGELRDRLLARFARNELLSRVRGKAFLACPGDYREELFATVRSVVADCIPPSVDARLSPPHRVAMALVRADRRDVLEAVARAEAGIRARTRVKQIAWDPGGGIAVAFEAWLEAGREAVVFERHGDRMLLGIPALAAQAVPAAAREVPVAPSGSVLVLLRRREDSAELRIAAAVNSRIIGLDGGRGSGESERCAIRYDVAARFDPAVLVAHGMSGQGRWDVIARVEMQSYAGETRIGDAAFAVDKRGRFSPLGTRGSWAGARALYEWLPMPLQRVVRAANARLGIAARLH